MRTIRLATIPVLAVALAACTSSPQRASSVHRPDPVAVPVDAAPAEVLVLGSGAGLAALDPARGAVLFDGPAVPALGRWNQVFTVTTDGVATVLDTHDAATGQTVSSTRVRGHLAIRVVSWDGRDVALMAPLPPGAGPWDPRPRAATDLVIADPTGLRGPMRFHLTGNLEPERSRAMIRPSS